MIVIGSSVSASPTSASRKRLDDLRVLGQTRDTIPSHRRSLLPSKHPVSLACSLLQPSSVARDKHDDARPDNSEYCDTVGAAQIDPLFHHQPNCLQRPARPWHQAASCLSSSRDDTGHSRKLIFAITTLFSDLSAFSSHHFTGIVLRISRRILFFANLFTLRRSVPSRADCKQIHTKFKVRSFSIDASEQAALSRESLLVDDAIDS